MVTPTSAVKHLQTTLEVPTLRKKYYAETLEASKEGKKVAWCSNNIPSEILEAMDVTAVFVENYTTVCAAKRLSSGFCRAGERAGFSQDVCGYARILMGYILGGEDAPEAPYGGLAKPDFLIVNSYSCDSRMGWFATMSQKLNLPLYVLDSPYQPEGGCDDYRNAVYTESELEAFVSFLEQQTDTKLDRAKLRDILALRRRTADILVEINELRKAIPCPMGAGDAFTAYWPMMYMAGTKACDEFYQRLLAEVRERVEKGIGVVPEERFRVFWTGLPFWYEMRLMNYFEDFGGVVATETFYHFDEPLLPVQDEDPIKDMALTSTRQRLYREGIEAQISEILNMVRDYEIDGVVVSFNPSCRLAYLPQLAIKNALEEKGIPTLSLECDMADERTYAEGQVKTRLDAFIERLLAR